MIVKIRFLTFKIAISPLNAFVKLNIKSRKVMKTIIWLMRLMYYTKIIKNTKKRQIFCSKTVKPFSLVCIFLV